MTHSELVNRALHWLAGRMKCFVTIGGRGVDREIVDAIGWGTDGSVVIECKASRSDFLADHKKPCRQPGYEGLGEFRYYMVAKDLVQPDEVPEGWGLLWVYPKIVRRMVPATRREETPRMVDLDRRMLLSEGHRLHWKLSVALSDAPKETRDWAAPAGLRHADCVECLAALEHLGLPRGWARRHGWISP